VTPNFDAQLADLKRHVAARGRSMSEIDVTVVHQPADKTALAALAEKGVNRVVLSLPTVGRDEALKVLDAYAPMVEWAKSL
jgi:hypothetical protein